MSATTYSDDTLDVLRMSASLLDAAARDKRASAITQINCLAAIAALRVEGELTDINRTSTGDPHGMINEALRLLGSLPFSVFDSRPVLTAARYARRALTGRPG